MATTWEAFTPRREAYQPPTLPAWVILRLPTASPRQSPTQSATAGIAAPFQEGAIDSLMGLACADAILSPVSGRATALAVFSAQRGPFPSEHWLTPPLPQPRVLHGRGDFHGRPMVQNPAIASPKGKIVAPSERLIMDAIDGGPGVVAIQQGPHGAVADKQHVPTRFARENRLYLADNPLLCVDRAFPPANAVIRASEKFVSHAFKFGGGQEAGR
jgi:hypothetical protein